MRYLLQSNESSCNVVGKAVRLLRTAFAYPYRPRCGGVFVCLGYVRYGSILLKNSTLWGKWHSDIDGNDAG
jgi:hypothetical protein